MNNQSKRDWQVDWELTMRATPGPWEVVPANSEGPYLIRMPYPAGGTWYGVRMVAWREDAGFIAEARTGWPAALEERARLAERVKELEEENRRLQAVAEAAKILDPQPVSGCDCADCYAAKRLQQALAALDGGKKEAK